MKRALVIAAAVGGLVGAISCVRWVSATEQAVGIGAGMLAKQVCSCMFVAERSLPDCRADQRESMDRIEVEVLRAPNGVRAFVPMFGERTATFSPTLGCTLQ